MPISRRAKVMNRFADGIEARHGGPLPARDRQQRPAGDRDQGADHAACPNGTATTRRCCSPTATRWCRCRAATTPTPRASRWAWCGILSSFNHPLMIASKSLAPALATGNSVVLKPSEQTPLTALLLAEIAHRGRPAARRAQCDPGPRPGGRRGALRAPGRGQDHLHRRHRAGPLHRRRRPPSASPARRWSWAARRRSSSSTTRPWTWPPRAPPSAGSSAPGRPASPAPASSCSAASTTRSSAALVAQAEAIRIGDPVATRHPARAGHLRARARPDPRLRGDRRVRGGAASPPGAPRSRSRAARAASSSRPTVLVGVTNDMRVAREEIFGPVRRGDPLRRRGRGDRASPTTRPSAWAPSIWTREVARAHRVAAELETGHRLGQRPPPPRPLLTLGRRARERHRPRGRLGVLPRVHPCPRGHDPHGRRTRWTGIAATHGKAQLMVDGITTAKAARRRSVRGRLDNGDAQPAHHRWRSSALTRLLTDAAGRRPRRSCCGGRGPTSASGATAARTTPTACGASPRRWSRSTRRSSADALVTVARVQGDAAGFGAGLAALCDVAVRRAERDVLVPRGRHRPRARGRAGVAAAADRPLAGVPPGRHRGSHRRAARRRPGTDHRGGAQRRRAGQGGCRRDRCVRVPQPACAPRDQVLPRNRPAT